MNRLIAFLVQPLPKAKLWHLVWLGAIGMFYGSWMQAVDTAEALGGGLSLRSHLIFLTPVWLMLVGFVASGIQWRRPNSEAAA